MAYTVPMENENINTLEKAKFEEFNDLVFVRTKSIGTLTPSGLSERLKTTTIEVGTNPIKLPTSALNNRNHIEIHNTSAGSVLYVGDSDQVTADRVVGITSGKEIPPQSFYNIDIAVGIELYGVVSAGTIIVKITEVA
jgi:hypothetical protein